MYLDVGAVDEVLVLAADDDLPRDDDLVVLLVAEGRPGVVSIGEEGRQDGNSLGLEAVDHYGLDEHGGRVIQHSERADREDPMEEAALRRGPGRPPHLSNRGRQIFAPRRHPPDDIFTLSLFSTASRGL